MAWYFLGQCKSGKQVFGASKQLGLLPWQVSCGVFSLGADCSWAFPCGTLHTPWHFLQCGTVVGCGGCWHRDMGCKRRVPRGKCVPAWAGSAWLKTCTLSLPVIWEGRGGVRMDSLFSKVSDNKLCSGVTALLSFLSSDQRCQG